MVISSPCLTEIQELASPEQRAKRQIVKEFILNLLMADSMSKTIQSNDQPLSRDEAWENELTNTKKFYGFTITKLVKRVKKLEKQVKTSKARRRTKIVLSEDEAVEENSSKQGRSLIEELDMYADIYLVPPYAEIQEKVSDETEVFADTALNTASVPFSTASATSGPFSTASATPEVSTAAANLVYIRRSAEKRKDKEEVPRLKRAGQDVEAKPAKRQRTEEVLELAQEQTDEEPKTDELSQEQLNQMVFKDMLKNFDREDLEKLWSLVQERYNSSGLAKDKEIELWVELKMLFEPDVEIFLELQKDMHDPLNWWLYDTCAVHHVSIKKGQDIFMLVEKDYPLTKGLATLMIVNKLRVDQHSEMADELLTKIYNIANIPRN
ncbi:hypothetical protein Tco_0145119 [Tanacetum coccineum]